MEQYVLLKMFPTKPWTLNGSKTLIWKIDVHGSIKRCPGALFALLGFVDVEDLVLIDTTIRQWRKRLQACVALKEDSSSMHCNICQY